MSVLTTQKRSHTLWATVNRPKSRNAINFEVMNELEKVLDRLENDSSLRTLVLSGYGERSFISGGDLKEFHTLKTASEARSMARRMLTICERLEKLPCWTIACINGAAYGGGCEIMLACDFRIAAYTARFGFTQAKFYLPPGWGGLTRLTERVGRSTALKWLAEAAVIHSDTAFDYRLIDKVVPYDSLIAKTWEWAQNFTRNERDYISSIKLGALESNPARWKAIEAELEPFSKFWEDERHQQRVEKFIDDTDSEGD